MSFSCYVAGRTTDVERVRHVQQLVRDVGGWISFDWTGSEGEVRKDWSDDLARAREIATREKWACQNSDLTIVCWNEGGLGMHYETAYAHGADKLIVIYGEPDRDCVFWRQAGFLQIATEDTLKAWLQQFGRTHPLYTGRVF